MVKGVEFSQVKRDFLRAIGQEWYRASLGDGDGIIYEPGRPGYVRVRYVTANELSLPTTVRMRATIPMRPGIAVIVQWSAFDRGYAVVAGDFDGLEQQEVSPLVMNAADPNAYAFKPSDFIPMLMSHPFTTPEADSLKVAVREFPYLDASGTWHFFGGVEGGVDLTSSIPGGTAQHRLAGLFLKTDDTIEVSASTAQSQLDPLVLADVQECQAGASAGSLPVWFWRLYTGQTAIVNEDSFLDGRQFISRNAVGGTGTVTSVALTMPSEFSVAGSPITSAGTLAVTKANENANTAFAGPASGSAAAPSFRALVEADIPALGDKANSIPNASFDNWENGTTSAPDNWVLTGASATVARETGIVKHGITSAKVTRSGTDCHLSVALQSQAGIGYNQYLNGRTYTFSAWVYATVASRVRLRASYGSVTFSSYHTGGSSWEYLSVTFTAGNVASITVGLAVDTGDTSGYIDAAVIVEGSRAGLGYQPQLHDFNQFPQRAFILAATGLSTATATLTIDTAQVLNSYWGVVAANANDGDEITWSVWLAAGTYTIEKVGVEASTRGKLDWTMDGASLTSGEDWYNAATTHNVSKSNSVSIYGNGYHVLKSKVNGKNASSSDFTVQLSYIHIYPAAD